MDEKPLGVNGHDPLPVLAADRGLLLRVLQNLIGNAIKYADPGEPELRRAARR